MERLRQWRQCHWPNDEEDEDDDDSESDILEVWDEKRGDYDAKADEDFDQWSRNSSRHEQDELDELDDDESMSAAYNEPFGMMQRDTVNEESAYDEEQPNDDASISSNSSISSISSSSHLSRFCRRRDMGAAKKVASVSFDRSSQEAALDNENDRHNADNDDDDDDAMDAWNSSTSSRSNNGHGGIPHDRIHQRHHWSNNDVISIASSSSNSNSSSNNHAGNSQWSNHDVARVDELVPPVQNVAKLLGNRESSPIDLLSSNGNDASDGHESNVPSVASRKNDRGVERMTTKSRGDGSNSSGNPKRGKTKKAKPIKQGRFWGDTDEDEKQGLSIALYKFKRRGDGKQPAAGTGGSGRSISCSSESSYSGMEESSSSGGDNYMDADFECGSEDDDEDSDEESDDDDSFGSCSDQGGDSTDVPLVAWPKGISKLGAVSNRLGSGLGRAATAPSNLLETREYKEARIGFCCYQCHCVKPRKARDNYWQSQTYRGLTHRKCCHGIKRLLPNMCVPIEAKNQECEKALTMVGNKVGVKWTPKVATKKELRASRKTQIAAGNRQAKQFRCSLKRFKDATTGRFSIPECPEKRVAFSMVPKRRKAIVLDLFGGIGTAIVALKRARIDIARIIHVEHDNIATHVYKYNHLPGYMKNNIQNDGIDHVFIEKFELVDLNGEDLLDFIERYGPFDILIGGAPCVDFSRVNARRRGTDGKQGSYQVRFGMLYNRIQQAQGEHHRVHVIAENVPIQNKPGRGDLTRVMKAFGASISVPVVVDAQFYSPVRRQRMYFTNVPRDEALSSDLFVDPHGACCLEDGFKHGALLESPNLRVRYATFMASSGRINDPRMYVYKPVRRSNGKTKYISRSLYARERETMMGFPPGYVGEPVKSLFATLLRDGLQNTTTDQTYWKDALPPEFHVFGGTPYMIHTLGPGEVTVAYSPPRTGKTIQYFDHDEYAKHLIGNAFSLPVMDIFVSSLKSKFQTRRYPGFEYEYAWKRES